MSIGILVYLHNIYYSNKDLYYIIYIYNSKGKGFKDL